MAFTEVIQGVKKLNSKELKEFGNELAKNLLDTDTSEVVRSLVDSMPPDAKKKAVTETTATFTDKERKEVAAAMGLGDPSAETRDKLWTIAVWAFAVVMVGAFLFIAAGTLVTKPQNPVTTGEILLSIFTAAVGFFAGLFAPSPGKGG